MNRRVAAAGAALLIIGLPATAAGKQDSSPWDSVAGAGKVVGPDQSFNVSAQDGPNGVKGEMTLDRGTTRVKADVNCLKVSGAAATVQGRVTKSDDPLAPVGKQLTFYLRDNGSPGKGADVFAAHLVPLCGKPVASVSSRPFDQGNVVVSDSP